MASFTDKNTLLSIGRGQALETGMNQLYDFFGRRKQLDQKKELMQMDSDLALQRQRELLGLKQEADRAMQERELAEFMATDPKAQSFLKGGGVIPKDDRGRQIFSDYIQFMDTFDSVDDNTKKAWKDQRLTDPNNFRGRERWLQDQVSAKEKAAKQDEELSYVDQIAQGSDYWNALETDKSKEMFKTGIVAINNAVKTPEGAEIVADLLEAAKVGNVDQDDINEAIEKLGMTQDNYPGVAINGANVALSKFISDQGFKQGVVTKEVAQFREQVYPEHFKTMVDAQGNLKKPEGWDGDMTSIPIEEETPEGVVVSGYAHVPTVRVRDGNGNPSDVLVKYNPRTKNFEYNRLDKNGRPVASKGFVLDDATIVDVFGNEGFNADLDEMKSDSEKMIKWISKTIKENPPDSPLGQRARAAGTYMAKHKLRPDSIKQGAPATFIRDAMEIGTSILSKSPILAKTFGLDKYKDLKDKDKRFSKESNDAEKALVKPFYRAVQYGKLKMLPSMILGAIEDTK